MERIVKAFGHSMRALRHLAANEKAIQQELFLLVLAVPAGWIVALSFGHFLFLIAAVLLLILVETLNTAVEATCNAITRETREDIRIAKDCGSLAVLIASCLAGGVWLYAVWLRFFV